MSKIEVNKIGPQCGTTLTVGCGAGQTVTVDANTVTIGRCGGTVALASGASQTGFGRSGSVNWQTGSLKTSTFTAVSGEGYFINSGSAITANLPAGSAGAIVAFSDYARNFATYNLTISPNGSEKIGGIAQDAALNIDGQAATFVYVDSTKGWINVQNAEDTEQGSSFISATGGNATLTNGDFKTHIFTGPGTFCVSGGNGGLAVAEYAVVAGGGGVNQYSGGGGGGFRTTVFSCVPSPTTSPNGSPTKLSIVPGTFPVTVGGGGSTQMTQGSSSVFSTIVSAGGGGGKGSPNGVGQDGGSGGGGRGAPAFPGTGFSGGSGNTPSVTPPQGNPGGKGWDGLVANTQGGGGGGAGAAGADAANAAGGTGGVGDFVADTVFGPTAPSYGTPGPTSSVRYFAGGGGGATNASPPTVYPGGSGGGGNGGGPSPGTAGTTNTGGGGGGGTAINDRAGGSGIVVIRYKFQ